MKAKFLFLAVTLVSTALAAQDWSQWAFNPQHTGQVFIPGQSLNRNIVDLVYDPLVPQERAVVNAEFGSPDLLAHYQSPLVDGNDVYMMYKSGTYTQSSYATQNWGETKYTWSGSTLNVTWQFASDWKAPGNQDDFWEPVFHPALANSSLYVPGAGGSIFKVNKATGAGARINPFNTVSQNVYTASPLTVDASGNILYNVVQLKAGTKDFYADDVVDSWIVRVSPTGSIT